MNIKLKLLLISLFIFPLCVKAETINVNNYDQFKDTIQNNVSEINIESDITYDSLLTISNEVIIKGNNHKLNRDSNYSLGLFSITNTGNVTIYNLIIDGGTTKALPVTIKYGNTYVVDDDIPIREGYHLKGGIQKQKEQGHH